MKDIDFQSLLKSLEVEISKLALNSFKKYKKEVIDDSMDFLDKIKANLKIWTQQLASGELSNDDYKFLMLGQKDLIKMNALKRAGITLIEGDRFKNNLLDIVIKTVTGLL